MRSLIPALATLALMLALFGCINGGTTTVNSTQPASNGTGSQVIITYSNTTLSNATGRLNGSLGNQSQQNATGIINFSRIREYSMAYNDTLYIRMYNISIGGNEDRTRNENDRLTLITKGNFDAAVISVSDSKRDAAAYTLLSSADDIDVEFFPLVSASTSDTIKYVINLTKPGYVALPDTPDSSGIASYARAVGSEPVLVKDKANLTYSSLTFQIMNPPSGTFNDRLFSDADNNAVAFMLRDSRGFSMLFCNDIVEGAIGMIANKYTSALKTDVLVTPSYGTGGTGEAFNILASYSRPSWGIVEGYKRGAVTGIADPYVYVKTELNGYTRNVTALWDCRQFIISYDGIRYGTDCIKNATSSTAKPGGTNMPTGGTSGGTNLPSGGGSQPPGGTSLPTGGTSGGTNLPSGGGSQPPSNLP